MMRLPPHLARAAMRTTVKTDRDVLDDYADEVAAMHSLPRDETRRRFARFMDVYHYRRQRGTAEEWGAIHGGEVEHSFIRVSKPFRFRNQEVIPRVLDALAEHLPPGSAPARVLDFGGGFGNDAIVYARSGYEAHYSDLLSLKNADVVRRRFALRGLEIPMHDAFALPPIRFDAISAVDVLEHVYDVEEVTAQLAGRLPQGGLLVCANAFGAISFDGDHHDKNRVYVPLFRELLRTAGFKLVVDEPPLEVFRRTQQPIEEIDDDVAQLRRVLYAATRDYCVARSRKLLEICRDGAEPAWSELAGVAQTLEDDPAARRERALALAGRYAPRFLKRAVRERRGRELRRGVDDPADVTEALGLLADHVAVLRIAENRLRRVGAG